MIAEIDFSRPDLALAELGTGRQFTYRELGDAVAGVRKLLGALPRPALVFQFCANSVGAVVSYLACLGERLPLGLGEPSPELRERVVAAYQPTAVILAAGETAPADYEFLAYLWAEEVALWVRPAAVYAVSLYEKLALLLATSGSTGDAKLVRLTADNLAANAKAIGQYLRLGTGERAVQSLPIHYSYGLSILNSHLAAGGAVGLTPHSFMRPEFWQAAKAWGATSFAGVPYMYETMLRLRINPFERGGVHTITQAGGHLRPELVERYREQAEAARGRMFVMYGQTEATARIAYVPPERLAEKPGTIGIAIPGGELWLQPVEGDAALKQLFYRGPNVMLGYASEPADLAKGDELEGVLATGDLAECDAQGYFKLTGRLARLAKLFGKRVNLASVESEVEKHYTVRTAAVEAHDGLKLFLEGATPAVGEQVKSHLAKLLGVPPMVLSVQTTDRLPMTASGKKDYKALA